MHPEHTYCTVQLALAAFSPHFGPCHDALTLMLNHDELRFGGSHFDISSTRRLTQPGRSPDFHQVSQNNRLEGNETSLVKWLSLVPFVPTSGVQVC